MSCVALVLLAILGAALQRAVGAGYSLLVLPAALTCLGADAAVPCVLAVGVILGSALLIGHGAPSSLGRATPVLLAAPVGQVAATIGLGALDAPELRVLTAALLAAGVAVAWRPLPALPTSLAVVAGVLLGAIAALSGVIGPFLGVILVALRDASPAETRRRLWLGLTLLCATGLAARFAAGTGSARGVLWAGALTPGLLAGVWLGGLLDGLLPVARRMPAILGVALIGAVVLVLS